MCTAITLHGKDLYFGRTLDLERTYGEEVVITPRGFTLEFSDRPPLKQHCAMIGMAHVSDGYPLYYDGMNEAGVCMAGLNFPGNAHYGERAVGKDNVACHEFIPWVLGQCTSVAQARERMKELQLTGVPFSSELPTAQLHWIIADRTGCITVESRSEGIRIHENPVGVLTNNPPFEDQMLQLQNYIHLSANPPHNHFSQQVDLKPYSRGMGAIGLPGDLSSQSRFVRAAFTKLNSLCTEEGEISRFFHALSSVNQTRGCCRLEDGSSVITQYTSCCDAGRGIYYYTTYGNRRICAVELHREDPEGDRLICFPLMTGEDILFVNKKVRHTQKVTAKSGK